MATKTITVPVSVTIHEPDLDEHGRIRTLFVFGGLNKGGGYFYDGTYYLYGCTAERLVSYLPGEYAFELEVSQIVLAAIDATKKESPC